MPKPNDRIGPYQLIRKLGKGSFGEVWLAQPDKKESSPVAVKLSNDPDLDVNALLQEVTVWARAGRHPNVVEFLGVQVYDQQAVIVSEFVPDGSLEQWLRQHGGRAPSIESAIRMIDGILAGLEYLHSISVIHRDLKPANILMHGDTPRLADFGHSRVLDSSIHSSKYVGTPAYSAPEAFDAVRNEQTDLWSIGVIFYEMLVGRRPFPQRDSNSLIKAILMDEPQQRKCARLWSGQPPNRFGKRAKLTNQSFFLNVRSRKSNNRQSSAEKWWLILHRNLNRRLSRNRILH